MVSVIPSLVKHGELYLKTLAPLARLGWAKVG